MIEKSVEGVVCVSLNISIIPYFNIFLSLQLINAHDKFLVPISKLNILLLVYLNV
jgi:hypothetical protein